MTQTSSDPLTRLDAIEHLVNAATPPSPAPVVPTVLALAVLLDGLTDDVVVARTAERVTAELLAAATGAGAELPAVVALLRELDVDDDELDQLGVLCC